MGSMTLLGAGKPPVAGGGDAAQTTAFLARTSGLSGTETAAYKAMINGLVADGVWAKLDALYIFATNTTTTANLNLVSTSFGLTLATGSTDVMGFVADQGYTPNDGNTCLDTGLVLTAASQYALNSATIGFYDLTNKTTGSSQAMGVVNGGDSTQVQLAPAGSGIQIDINESNFPTASMTTTQGLWIFTRTSSTTINIYRNGAAFGTPSVSSTTSGVPTTRSMYICARNNNGNIGGVTDSERLSAAWIGGGFSGTDASNFASRLNAYMTALGINVY